MSCSSHALPPATGYSRQALLNWHSGRKPQLAEHRSSPALLETAAGRTPQLAGNCSWSLETGAHRRRWKPQHTGVTGNRSSSASPDTARGAPLPPPAALDHLRRAAEFNRQLLYVLDLNLNFRSLQGEDDGVPEEMCKNMVRTNIWTVTQQVILNKRVLFRWWSMLLSHDDYMYEEIKSSKPCYLLVLDKNKFRNRWLICHTW
jgi:hypothetical protein